MKPRNLIYLVACALFCGCASESTSNRGRGRAQNPLTETREGPPIVLIEAISFTPQNVRGRAGVFTLPAGTYQVFGRDSSGIYFLHDGPGVQVPGNFGMAQKGGVYVPTNPAVSVGVWIYPLHYSPEGGVAYLVDLPEAPSNQVRQSERK